MRSGSLLPSTPVLVLLGLVLPLSGCASAAPDPEPARQASRRAPRGPIPAPVLQANVLAGVPADYDDPCMLAMVFEPVDDDRAGVRIGDALLGLSARSQRTARDLFCTTTLAQARLLRLARLGRLDLSVELARPEPEARVVALLEVRRRRDRALLPAARPLIRDPQVGVASAAIRVIVGMADVESIQALQMLAIDPEALQLHGLACRALWDMGVQDACGGRPRDDTVGDLLGSAGGTAQDPCTASKQDLSSDDPAKVEGALRWFLSHLFVRMTAELDPIRVSCTNCEPGPVCPLPGRRLRRIARGGPSLASALASAVLLLRDGAAAPASAPAPGTPAAAAP
jgi:hypothetical protein